METVKKDKSTTERKISETSAKLQTNAKELNRQLNRLNSLNADIATTKNQVAGLRQHIDSLGSAINATADSIKILEGELESMRCAYVKSDEGLQPHRSCERPFIHFLCRDFLRSLQPHPVSAPVHGMESARSRISTKQSTA